MGLDVDPSVLAGAGTQLSGEGDKLAAALSALLGGISGAMVGHDGAAVEFGEEYVGSGQKELKAAAAAVNACRRMGYGIGMSAHNYALSNAMSTPGGGTPSVGLPAEAPTASAPTMPRPFGAGVAAPALWTVVETFVGYLWPDGDPATVRAAAQAWITFADALTGAAQDVGNAKGVIASQKIQEGEQVSAAIDDLSRGLTLLSDQCRSVADTLKGFAQDVEKAQNAIRDLLKRLSVTGILDEIGKIFSGDDPMEYIRAVVRDIQAVLDNMKREHKADMQTFQDLSKLIDSVTDSLEKWVSKEFPVVAPIINGYIDIENGVVHSVFDAAQGIEGLDPLRFLYDPSGAAEAWGNLAKVAAVVTNPELLPLVVAMDPKGALDLGKGLIDFKDWNSDHPLRGLGHNIGDVAQMFIPGVGEAKPAMEAAEVSARLGKTAEGLENAGSKGARDIADGGGLLGHSGAFGDASAQAGKTAADLDRVKLPDAPAPGEARPSPPPDPGPVRATPHEGGGPPSGPPSETSPHPGAPAAEHAPTEAPRAEPAPAEPSPAHAPEPAGPPHPEAPRAEPPPAGPTPAHLPAEPGHPAEHTPATSEPATTGPAGEPGGPAHSEPAQNPHDELPLPAEHNPAFTDETPHTLDQTPPAEPTGPAAHETSPNEDRTQNPAEPTDPTAHEPPSERSAQHPGEHLPDDPTPPAQRPTTHDAASLVNHHSSTDPPSTPPATAHTPPTEPPARPAPHSGEGVRPSGLRDAAVRPTRDFRPPTTGARISEAAASHEPVAVAHAGPREAMTGRGHAAEGGSPNAGTHPGGGHGDRSGGGGPPDSGGPHRGEDQDGHPGDREPSRLEGPDDHPPPPLHRDEPLPGKNILDQYKGENDPNNPNRYFRPKTVDYLSPEELEERRLFVKDGLLYSVRDGLPFDTRSAETLFSPGKGRAIYVMDRDGNLYASMFQEVGRFHHSSFLGGKPVAGAGEIEVRDGVPTLINRKSGHYQPSDEHLSQVRDMLQQQGIDISKILFGAGF